MGIISAITAMPVKSTSRSLRPSLRHMDAELKIWIRWRAEPIIKEFRKDRHLDEIDQILGMAVLD